MPSANAPQYSAVTVAHSSNEGILDVRFKQTKFITPTVKPFDAAMGNVEAILCDSLMLPHEGGLVRESGVVRDRVIAKDIPSQLIASEERKIGGSHVVWKLDFSDLVRDISDKVRDDSCLLEREVAPA